MPSVKGSPDESNSVVTSVGSGWSSWKMATFFVAGLFAIASVGLLLYASQNSLTPQDVDVTTRAKECRAEVVQRLDSTELGLPGIETISSICYNQIRGEALLEDFYLRRSNLTEQLVDGKIILWMVVVITLSGVALAALQLYAAYNLSLAGRDVLAASQEFILEKDKISLKSSVTGLMILAISFGFFIVYVTWVYTSKELRQERPESSASSSRSLESLGPLLESGGIGQLPSPNGNATEPEASEPEPSVP